MTNPQDYILPSSDAESRRLDMQSRLYGGIDILAPFLAQTPQKILDVGCGSGAFTRQVAAAVPESKVTGLETDASRVANARARAGSENVDYVHADLHAMPFEDGRFDLVYSRFVLVHDKDPARALRELARVTRPGGRVVIYDMVHEGIWLSPGRPAFAKLLQATIGILRERGAEPNQGLFLAAGLKRAGLHEVCARVIPHHATACEPLYDLYVENWQRTIASLHQELGARFEEGLIEAAQRELQRKTGEEFLVEITVLAWGVREADATLRVP